MKQFLFLFVAMGLQAYAQHNMQMQDRSVSWQKVYENPITPEAMRAHLLQQGTVKAIDSLPNALLVTIEGLPMDYKGAGGTEMGTSMYLSRSLWQLVARVAFKDGRYRVTASQMRGVFDYGAGILQQQGSTTLLEDAALRKRGTEFRPGFLKNDAPIIDHTLTRFFTYTEALNGDW